MPFEIRFRIWSKSKETDTLSLHESGDVIVYVDMYIVLLQKRADTIEIINLKKLNPCSTSIFELILEVRFA